jgi:16S rRNA (guanine(966)-N(2))-methyltransferase RsmD
MQRAKSSVFNSLGVRVHDGVFVDLYAAAGAVGIEALSRGAAFCCFVEKDPRALSCLRGNLERCRVTPTRYAVHATDAVDFLRRGGLSGRKPDVVYADPPYREGNLGVLLELLGEIDYPATAAIIIEHATGVVLNTPATLALARSKSFGQTSVSYFEVRV